MSYGAFALIRENSGFSLFNAISELDQYAAKEIGTNEVLIEINRYVFTLTYMQGESILAESVELLKSDKSLQGDFLPGNSRIEIYGVDDPDMDHFNDFVFIISKLAKHPSLLVYEQAGEEFI